MDHGKVAPPQLGEAALRDLVDAAFDALVIAHAGKVIFANRSFMEMSGWSGDDIIGRSLLDFVAPESRALVIQQMTASPDSRYEATGLRRDGTRIDVEICARTGTYDGKPVRISAIRYIDDRKAAENALRRSEARLRQLIERMTDMVIVQRRGTVVFANPAATRYLGFTHPAELIGRDVLDLVHPGDRADLGEWWPGGAEHPRSQLVTFRVTRRDGSVAIVEIAAASIDDFDAAPAILVLGRDVAERQRMETRLVQADLLSSIGMLAAGVAHEINNPMGYVTINLEVMTRKLAALRDEISDVSAPARANALVHEIQELLAITRDGAARVRQIVHDFRVFSRGRAESLSAIELPSVLDSTIQLAFNGIRHRARLVRDYAPVPLVEADEPRLGQLFLNLIVNALQALDDKGADGEDEICVRTRTASDGAAVVEIADSGAGIAPDVLGRVFEPFFSTKPVGVGTGLGLPICKSIVAALGGTITIDSAPGRGTTCRVTLPAMVRSGPAT